MRSFLNNNETKAYIVLGASLAFANTLLKNADGKEKTYLKYIKTYIEKYQCHVFDRLSDENNEKISRVLDINTVKIVPNTNPTVRKVILENDQIADLAEIVLDKCCSDCQGDCVDCKTRDALIGCFVPECCFDKDKCCYYMGD